MKTTYLSPLLVFFLQLMTASAVRVRNLKYVYDDRDTPMPVLIGFKESSSSSSFVASELAASYGIWDTPALKQVNAAQAVLSRNQVDQLINEAKDDILYVENDPIRVLNAEITSWGVTAIHATSNVVPPPPLNANEVASCKDPKSIKIAVIDSGLDVRHPDIPCYNISANNTNCIGASFGPGVGPWYEDSVSHGTLITGIIGATRGNGLGITGVLNNAHFCFLTARVYVDATNVSASAVLGGVQWAVQHGANVINLSLGGPTYSETEQNFVRLIRSLNILLIASTGSQGNNTINYPAGYDGVTSVGSVNMLLNRSDFSSYGKVDLVAPGEDILSTAPLGSSKLYFLEVSGRAESSEIQLMTRSVLPSGNLNGTVVDCPDFGTSVCPGAGGHICLIQRGVNSFEEKGLNCQRSGAVAAVVYNNRDGVLVGILANPTNVTIPVFGALQKDGLDVQANYLNRTAALVTVDGYSYAQGTSYAAAHATAAAAAIWQSCPKCSGNAVDSCLKSSAMDLGVPGRDQFYGNGLVQVDEAYNCLVGVGCCGNGTRAPTAPRPTRAPTWKLACKKAGERCVRKERCCTGVCTGRRCAVK